MEAHIHAVLPSLDKLRLTIVAPVVVIHAYHVPKVQINPRRVGIGHVHVPSQPGGSSEGIRPCDHNAEIVSPRELIVSETVAGDDAETAQPVLGVSRRDDRLGERISNHIRALARNRVVLAPVGVTDRGIHARKSRGDDQFVRAPEQVPPEILDRYFVPTRRGHGVIDAVQHPAHEHVKIVPRLIIVGPNHLRSHFGLPVHTSKVEYSPGASGDVDFEGVGVALGDRVEVHVSGVDEERVGCEHRARGTRVGEPLAVGLRGAE
mmetsp:Transcript_17589/g.56804  ORF Transcript_17589/g.56804 Transcript_17589/m.56804 type:complete len:263 (-) Transcript_17589:4754-5542(-)